MDFSRRARARPADDQVATEGGELLMPWDYATDATATAPPDPTEPVA